VYDVSEPAQPRRVSYLNTRDGVNGDRGPEGLTYIAADDSPTGEPLLVVGNFTPVVREGYRIGVPCEGVWQEVFNSDAECYGGSNVGNGGGVQAEAIESHGEACSLSLTLPPLGVVILRPQQ